MLPISLKLVGKILVSLYLFGLDFVNSEAEEMPSLKY